MWQDCQVGSHVDHKWLYLRLVGLQHLLTRVPKRSFFFELTTVGFGGLIKTCACLLLGGLYQLSKDLATLSCCVS